MDLVLSYGRKKFNIEISNGYAPGNIERNIVFLCGIHGRQLRHGDKSYTKIEESIQINLNNFHCNKHEIKIDFIDLERAKMPCYNEDNLAKWCRLFTATSEEEFQKKLGEINMDEKTSNKLYDEVTRLSEDEEYYGIYTELSHHEMLLNTAKEELEEAKHEVEKTKHEVEKAKHEAEKAKHEAEIMKQETEQAKQKAKFTEKVDIAKKMLLVPNITTEQIADITGLTIEEVQKL